MEVVVVTSRGPNTRKKYVLEAIKHGKIRILRKKPLAMDAAGCRRSVDAEVAYGKNWYRWASCVDTIVATLS